ENPNVDAGFQEMQGAVGEDRVGASRVKAVDLSLIRTIDGTRPRLRGPVVARALAKGQGPRDPGRLYGIDPWNRPARTPQGGPAGVFGDQDRLRKAVRNLGDACQVVLRQHALVIGCRVHETERHQTGIDSPDAAIVATGALAAVTVIGRVFHGR